MKTDSVLDLMTMVIQVNKLIKKSDQISKIPLNPLALSISSQNVILYSLFNSFEVLRFHGQSYATGMNGDFAVSFLQPKLISESSSGSLMTVCRTIKSYRHPRSQPRMVGRKEESLCFAISLRTSSSFLFLSSSLFIKLKCNEKNRTPFPDTSKDSPL